MPIAILKFKLPEEESEFNDAKHGTKIVCALQEFDTWLRNQSKYENKRSVSIESARKKLNELFLDSGIDIWN